MTRLAIALTLLLSGTALVAAQSPDDEIAAFITSDGFETLDTKALENALADHWAYTISAAPFLQVGPLEKAMLLVNSAIPSTRTRTAISYGEINTIGDYGPQPYSFIELRHYNLGAIIRADAAEAYGEENTADIEEFGLGDHLAWRFVFQSTLGNNAASLIQASSRVISDEEAAGDDCNGRPCLDPYSAPDESVAWQEIEGTLPTWPLDYADLSEGITTPAYAISQLAVLGFWANVELGHYQWTGGEHPEAARGYEPYRFISIDRNLGQELAIDTIWHETALNDDALASISFRYLDVAGNIRLMRASEPR